MTAYMVRHKVTKQWLLNKFKRRGRGRYSGVYNQPVEPTFWTDDVKSAAIWLRRGAALQTMRANRVNKESELVEFELEELC